MAAICIFLGAMVILLPVMYVVGCKVDLESFEASDITIACNLLCLAQG